MSSIKTIHDCLACIEKEHFPAKPLPKAKLLATWTQLPWKVPGDLRIFYEYCDGVRLFRRDDPPMEIVPLDAFHSTRIDIFGEDDDKWAPAAWHSIAYVQDGNYIAIDLASVEGDSAEILDCFHETFGIAGQQQVIAKSFTEFLSDSLSSAGRHYWLHQDGYGYR